MLASHTASPRMARASTFLVFLAAVLGLGLALPALAARKKTPERAFQVRPPADWVRPLALEARDTRAADESTGGVGYPLIDVQTRVSDRTVESYSHYVRQVLTEGGIGDAAEISVSFEPSFERLTIHGVWLHRGGERRNVFDPGAVKVIQQERELEQRLYNGTLSALIFVRDVRVGDSIEYAYSVEGQNPVFDGHFSAHLMARFSEPVGHWHQRLLWPARRTLNVKNHGTALTPTTKDEGGVREYVWEQHDVPEVRLDDSLPSWYDPWPAIQLSEYASWSEVVRWAVPLYQTPSKLSPELSREVERLRSENATPSARLLAALRFVQDQVRYLGIELGPNSHRPHAPDEVLARRFGDCKDKSTLLVTLLRGLGLEARPVLVSTSLQHTVEAQLPTPGVFDHVIVQARLDGRDYWVDPTASQERGSLSQVQPPPYGRALPIDEAATGLVEIPRPGTSEPTVDVEEAYVENGDGMSAKLTVQTRYRGQDADDMRRTLSSKPLKDLEREYLNYYARSDPKIRSAAPLKVVDDPKANVLTLVESYVIDPFWTDGSRDFHASTISNYVVRPRIAQRTMPLAITHPVHVRHRVRFAMRERITLESDRKGVVEGPASRFEYEHKLDNGGRLLLLDYRYRSLADVVDTAQLTRHLKTLDRMESHLGFQVSSRTGPVVSEEDRSFYLYVIIGGICIGAFFFLIPNNPRAKLREFKAWRRKRAFSRKFDSVEGEFPAQAIPLGSLSELSPRISRMRCACGSSNVAGTPATAEIRLGEQVLVLAKWTCAKCGRARHAYFSVGGSPEA